MLPIEEWVDEGTRRGINLRGDRLRPAAEAKVVKVRGGELVVTDGPYAETKEWIAGYDLLECTDLDEAIEYASRHPMAKGGRVEIRPAWPFEEGRDEMQYFLTILSAPDAEPYVSAEDNIADWAKEADERGIHVTGNRLRPLEDATLVRRRRGELLVTDGPFAEGRELILGFDVLECDSHRRGHRVRVEASDGAFRADRGARRLAVRGRQLTEPRPAPPASPSEVRAALARAHRDEWGKVFGTIVRFTGDWNLAEDCTQDAFARALERWEADGIPRNPGAWLTVAARNRALDVLRRATTSGRSCANSVELSVDRRAPGRRRFRRSRRLGGRAPEAALHLLPPRAADGGPGRPDPPHGRGARHVSGVAAIGFGLSPQCGSGTFLVDVDTLLPAAPTFAIPLAVCAAQELPAVKSESASPGLGHRGPPWHRPYRLDEGTLGQTRKNTRWWS